VASLVASLMASLPHGLPCSLPHLPAAYLATSFTSLPPPCRLPCLWSCALCLNDLVCNTFYWRIHQLNFFLACVCLLG
jgi:hypothetical protein